MNDQWIQTIMTIGSFIITIGAATKVIRGWQKEQKKETKFIMKILFEIIHILEGAKINGQVDALRREAEQFNIDN